MGAKPRVGVIGVGAMGMGVAKRLLLTGFPVCVRDIRPEAQEQAGAAGAQVCASPAEVARRCGFIVTLVVDDAQTDEVLFGVDGAAESMGPGGVVIMSSTLPPRYAASAGERLQARGLHLLDAPVSGGPAKALAGQMSMMLAGTPEAFERSAPVLEAISGRRFRISDRPGDGSKAKIVNNMLAGVNLAAACEAMALGIKLGLDPKIMFDVVNASSGSSWMFGDRMPRVLGGDYAPRAAVDILKKDLTILQQTAQELNFPVPMATAGQHVFADAVELGLGGEDDAALIKLYRTLAGIELPGDQ